jgi:hypothetical protein
MEINALQEANTVLPLPDPKAHISIHVARERTAKIFLNHVILDVELFR